MSAVATENVVVRLMELLEQTTNEQVSVPRDDVGPDSIRNTGIDSVNLLNFLVTVEDEFGIEWDDEVSPETLNSFAAMAAHIAKELGLDA
jgi:acyl carrier protein